MDSGRIPFNPDAFLLHELIKDIHLSMHEMVVSKDLEIGYAIEARGGSDYVIPDREKIRQFISKPIRKLELMETIHRSIRN